MNDELTYEISARRMEYFRAVERERKSLQRENEQLRDENETLWDAFIAALQIED